MAPGFLLRSAAATVSKEHSEEEVEGPKKRRKLRETLVLISGCVKFRDDGGNQLR